MAGHISGQRHAGTKRFKRRPSLAVRLARPPLERRAARCLLADPETTAAFAEDLWAATFTFAAVMDFGGGGGGTPVGGGGVDPPGCPVGGGGGGGEPPLATTAAFAAPGLPVVGGGGGPFGGRPDGGGPEGGGPVGGGPEGGGPVGGRPEGGGPVGGGPEGGGGCWLIIPVTQHPSTTRVRARDREVIRKLEKIFSVQNSD
ncbi:hypothetical protein BV898_02681 [Hypsibius exemplaris]|uniref:Uncharacterized protein n=1 Tax=Hypsibius exemplaris TaxID=2072580 RepID=A0A1W0X8B1_HYPEX|nr:hypothetical protein BV898_02681 [Hypsibius exemplaris]